MHVGAFVDRVEQAILGLLLAVMTLLTAGQALARAMFSISSPWVLEVTTLLFAWLILFGMSYGIKVGAHLGVDAIIRLFPKPWQRLLPVAAAMACILYAAILFDASWLAYLFGDQVNARGGALDYVWRMYSIGIEMEDLAVPRWIGYIILPIGLLLFAFRSVQAIWQIASGQRNNLIAGHEAEDLIGEAIGGDATTARRIDAETSTATRAER